MVGEASRLVQVAARNVEDMRALAVVCDKTGLQFSAVDSKGAVIEESDIEVPASRTDRGAQLGWLLDEAEISRRSFQPL